MFICFLYALLPGILFAETNPATMPAALRKHQAQKVRAEPYIELYSNKDAARVQLSRSAAFNPNVSMLISTALEFDARATEIPLFIQGSMIRVLLPILELIDDMAPPNQAWDQIPAKYQKLVLEKIEKMLPPCDDNEAIDLLYSANYLSAPVLLSAAAWRYATYLHDRKSPALLNFKKNGLSDLRPLISQQFFLHYKQDIDKALGLSEPTFIPADLLVAYGLLPAKPNMEVFLHDLAANRSEEIKQISQSNKLMLIRALLKIRNLNVDYTASKGQPTPLILICKDFGGNEEEDDYRIKVIYLLLQAGADIDAIDMYGNSPMKLAITVNKLDQRELILEMLLKFHPAINMRYYGNKAENGWTILDVAIQRHRFPPYLIKLLRKHGALLSDEIEQKGKLKSY